jgi:hypothetical protein
VVCAGAQPYLGARIASGDEMIDRVWSPRGCGRSVYGGRPAPVGVGGGSIAGAGGKARAAGTAERGRDAQHLHRLVLKRTKIGTEPRPCGLGILSLITRARESPNGPLGAASSDADLSHSKEGSAPARARDRSVPLQRSKARQAFGPPPGPEGSPFASLVDEVPALCADFAGHPTLSGGLTPRPTA